MDGFSPISDDNENAEPLDSFLQPEDDRFPSRVKELYPECSGLYIRGNPEVLRTGIAIIGARKATPYGLRVAALIGQWASELGFTVFSGCARGCDQAAQQSALDSGGRAVGVMGCGADVIYPSNAQDILESIVQNGALVSEYGWGSPPMKYRFRQRNRLLAALASLVVVVEARVPSGTFSAVNHALELGTPVAAVPGSIFSFDSAGPNRIIGDGAYVIGSRDDFLAACSLSTVSLDSNLSIQPSEEEEPLLQLLRSDAYFPEDIALHMGTELIETMRALNAFEIAGKATRYPDGRFSALI